MVRSRSGDRCDGCPVAGAARQDLMYGLPSAAGARDFPTRPATAKIVTRYGSMSVNSLGTGAAITERVFCRFDAKPNSSAARVALIGSHWPKITAARAMKPAPAVISLLKAMPEPIV